MKNLLIITLLLVSLIALAQSTQCLGATKAGNRCKNMTKNSTGYCYLHEDLEKEYTPNYIYNPPKNITNNYNNNSYKSNNYNNSYKSSTSVQCSGITKSGASCKRTTTNPNGRCYQH